jgi:hypothetical protein
MRPFSVGVTTWVHGLYTALALLVLADVASPTFNMQGFPHWTGMQAAAAGLIFATASLALGVVMHTMTRSLFHDAKESWTVAVLTSDSVGRRLGAVRPGPTIPGGPTFLECLEGEGRERRWKLFEFMHGIDSQLLSRAPHVYETIQIYREQYRLARAFVVPSVIFAITLPFWDPMRTLDGAGSIGPFPIIRTQLFLLSALAGIVSFMAFRERAYRYAAAKVLAYVTLEGADESTPAQATGEARSD